MATTANPTLPVYLRIADSPEQQIGEIGVPLVLNTTATGNVWDVKLRLVDSAPDRVRERLVAVLREAADAIETTADTR
jgi:hypothetical protein